MDDFLLLSYHLFALGTSITIQQPKTKLINKYSSSVIMVHAHCKWFTAKKKLKSTSQDEGRRHEETSNYFIVYRSYINHYLIIIIFGLQLINKDTHKLNERDQDRTGYRHEDRLCSSGTGGPSINYIIGHEMTHLKDFIYRLYIY